MNSGVIYCIENKINHKKYIGQTNYFIGRKAEHFNRLRKNKHINQKLQNAFNKYGEENFFIYPIEENLPAEVLNEKEIYYIKYYDTYHNGYNLTLGGEGKLLFDIEPQEIVNKFKELGTVDETAAFYGTTPDTICKRMKLIGFKACEQPQNRIKPNSKKVKMNYKGKWYFFDCQGFAADWVIHNLKATAKRDTISANIGRSCKGTRQFTYGLKWYYIEDEDEDKSDD